MTGVIMDRLIGSSAYHFKSLIKELTNSSEGDLMRRHKSDHKRRYSRGKCNKTFFALTEISRFCSDQCDQMPILFPQYLSICNNENLLNSK